ncbi:MAG: tetratricopeptide repeat protein [Bacteroidales bacterium]|nr:tetratricopeptide repeat protein [Bacteroidales bacterium]
MKNRVIISIVLSLLFSMASVSQGQEQDGNRDYQYALIEAVKQKNLGNLSEAIKLYGLVIKDRPDCAVAYFESGSIYLATNQFELARKNTGKAYELDPGNEWYTIAYLNSLAATEEYEEAVAILKEKIKSDPEKIEWEFKLALSYFNMEKSRKAIKTLERIEKEKGFSEKITLLKASIYESEEKYDQAREEIEKVMLIFPEAIQFRVVAAELCLKSGDESAAASYYLEILEVDSLNIFALTNLTDYYRQQGDYKNSYIYLAKSFGSTQIEAQRKMAILSYYLAEEDHITNYSSELSVVIEVFAETHPEESDIRLLAADFYIQSQGYSGAYMHLKKYLELQKGTYNIYMQTIMLANAAALNEELIYICEKALELYPDSADIRFFRGIGLYQANEFNALIDNFEGLDKDSYSSQEYASQAGMLIAEAYYRIDDYERSDSLFESLIREEPDNYMLLNNYSYYLAERGEKLEKAKVWSSDVVKNNPDNATFLDTYAWVLFKLESYEEAEKYILFALDKGGENDPEVNEHAGDIQKALESYQIATSYYLKAIILGGDKEKLEDKIDQVKAGEYE